MLRKITRGPSFHLTDSPTKKDLKDLGFSKLQQEQLQQAAEVAAKQMHQRPPLSPRGALGVFAIKVTVMAIKWRSRARVNLKKRAAQSEMDAFVEKKLRNESSRKTLKNATDETSNNIVLSFNGALQGTLQQNHTHEGAQKYASESAIVAAKQKATAEAAASLLSSSDDDISSDSSDDGFFEHKHQRKQQHQPLPQSAGTALDSQGLLKELKSVYSQIEHQEGKEKANPNLSKFMSLAKNFMEVARPAPPQGRLGI